MGDYPTMGSEGQGSPQFHLAGYKMSNLTSPAHTQRYTEKKNKQNTVITHLNITQTYSSLCEVGGGDWIELQEHVTYE